MSAFESRPRPHTNPRDLYCPGCGYNLRGLPGDPIRCPECGRFCPLQEVELPAAAIRARLVRLESASAYSVLLLYGLAGALLLLLSNRAIWAGQRDPLIGWSIIGVVATGMGLCLTLATSRRSCDAHPEWFDALVRYHVFGLLMFAGVFGLIALFHTLYIATFRAPAAATSGPPRLGLFGGGYLGGLLATLVACGFWAAYTYRQATSHLRRLQRDVAVRIARKELARYGRRGADW